MRAMVVNQVGSVDEFQMMDVAKPVISQPDQVLVQVFAAGVNPVDTKLRANGLFFADQYPAILGCDGAGVVAAVGDAVVDFVVGDPVYYCYGGLGHQCEGQSVGNYAEYALIPAAFVAAKPDSIGDMQAAAAPLVFLTAWEALFDRAGLQSGQKVFIHAGAGGVGHVAIQLAKIAGCEVATTVSTDAKASFVRDLGADKVINYKKEDVAEALLAWTDGKGVDIAFDTVGGEAFTQLIPAMADYGDLVTILQVPDDVDWKALRLKNVRVSQELMLTPMLNNNTEAAQHQAAILEQCGQFIDEGFLKIHVGKMLALEDVAEAQTLLEEGHMQGKIVLAVAGEEEVS